MVFHKVLHRRAIITHADSILHGFRKRENITNTLAIFIGSDVIYEYLLSNGVRVEKLNLRQFDDDDKRTAYETQKGVCPKCGGSFAYEEMEGDHIVPWSKGGKTVLENLQMLCRRCNAIKSDRF